MTFKKPTRAGLVALALGLLLGLFLTLSAFNPSYAEEAAPAAPPAVSGRDGEARDRRIAR